MKKKVLRNLPSLIMMSIGFIAGFAYAVHQQNGAFIAGLILSTMCAIGIYNKITEEV